MNELPVDTDAERRLLGSVWAGLSLNDPEARAVLWAAPPEAFFISDHRRVWDGMQSLVLASGAISEVALLWKISRTGKATDAGHAAILELLSVGADLSPEPLLARVLEMYSRRTAINAADKVRTAACDLTIDPETVQTEANNAFMAVSRGVTSAPRFIASDECISTLSDGLPFLPAGSSKKKLWTGVSWLDDLLVGSAKNVYIVAGRPGGGKCLGKGTPVLKHDGSVVPVESVVVGDLLMGPDSLPRRVLGTCSGMDALFRIHPVKGDTWICNSPHILSLVVSGDVNDSFTRDCIYDIPLPVWRNLPSRVKAKLKQWRAGVEFTAHTTNIPPYLLGIWIGDGTLKSPQITTPDPEIVDYLREFCSENGYKLSPYLHPGKCDQWSITTARGCENPVWTEFKTAISGGEKRIPRRYLVNSRNNRLSLLAGLLDTDGYLGHQEFQIITKYSGLRDDILFLCRSLGLAAYASFKKGAIKSSGFVGHYWSINISGDCSVIPTKVKRKQSPPRLQIKNVCRTGFKVSPAGHGEYFGFELDGDGRFLLGDFTVTHNTGFGLQIRNVSAYHGLKLGFFSLEMGPEELAARDAAWWLSDPKAGRIYSYKSLLQGNYNSAAAMAAIRDHIPSMQNGLAWHHSSGIPMGKLAAAITEGVQVHGLDGAVVDYFQYIAPSRQKGDSLASAYAANSMSLKRLAQELNIPIVVLSQLNRGTEVGQRPGLSDLKETSQLEQDASVVMMFYRNKDNVPMITIPKHRDGETIIERPLDVCWPCLRFTDEIRTTDEIAGHAVPAYSPTGF